MRGLCLLLLLLLLTAPHATAQTGGGVSKCTRQCGPKDADVNGPTIKRGDEPVKLVLYGHFEDILQRAPLNAQLPDPDREADLNRGFPMPVIDSNTPVEQANFHFKNNEFLMFSSPGLVEYGDQYWRIHQEPGLAAPLTISESEITLYWYLSAHAVPTRSSGDMVPVGAMPQVAVYARLETGRFPFHGTVIAESVDYDATLPPSDQRVNVIATPGQPDVYEFVVKMKVKTPVVPDTSDAQGFVLYVNPYQVKTDPQKGVQLAQEQWRLRTGPNFLPRLIVPVERTMETRAATMNLFDNRLFVRWTFVSALGSYDMRDAQLDLRATGANPIDPKAIDLVLLKKGIDHDAHFKPVNATWAIDYYAFPLADGEYELTASIPNLQETYLLEQRFQFTVKNGLPQVPSLGRNMAPGGAVVDGSGVVHDAKPSPAGDVAVALLVVACALAALRRRP